MPKRSATLCGTFIGPSSGHRTHPPPQPAMPDQYCAVPRLLVLPVIFMVAALLINPAVIVLPTAGDIAQGQQANAWRS